MASAQKSLRNSLRLVHILASVLLGAFLYSPLHQNTTATLAMGFAVFPLIAISGLWMWQGPRLVKVLTPPKSPLNS